MTYKYGSYSPKKFGKFLLLSKSVFGYLKTQWGEGQDLYSGRTTKKIKPCKIGEP